MTTDERVSSLHERMKDLRRKKEHRKTGLIGAAGAVLALCMFVLIFGKGTLHSGCPAGMYSGSIMLFEEAGGYILAAIISFAAAVVITIACIHWKKKQQNKSDRKNDEDKEENREE